MFQGHKVAVVVPARNEAAHIGDVLRAMPDYVDCIIVVDDGSLDETAEVAAAVGDPRVRVLRRRADPHGVGAAMVDGFRAALREEADLVVKVDGDGQMDPADISLLLRPLVDDGYDYAKANRFLHTEALRQMPTVRLLGNFVLTFLTKLASGYWHIFDPQNGFVAIRATRLKELSLDQLATDFFFENDVLIQLNILGARVRDVPVPARYGNEQSKLRVWAVVVSFPLRLGRGLLRRIWQKYVLRDFSPIAMFWLLGLPLLAFGLLFGLWHWVQSFRLGQPAPTGTIMLSVLPFLLGFELILQAIILEIRESPR